MTTIVYRDGLMAADTASFTHEGNLRAPFRVSKLRRLSDGSVIGGAGMRRDIVRFGEWLETRNGERPTTGNEYTIIQALPDGRVVIHDGPDEWEVRGVFCAAGSGAAAAYGALFMGASAREAVEIAMKLDPWTGGDVEIVPVLAAAESGPSSA